jgi:polyhydroxyalkanoate synthesis repressor PhaR
MAESVRVVKKYPNRRLYDTQTSGYITLDDVKKLVIANHPFKVLDAKTDEDLTRSILLQIILEEEGSGAPLFTAPMLSQMIRFYGNAMQGVMGAYLEKTMSAFVEIQANVADQSKVLGEGKMGSPELWTQFMSLQAPMVQSMMGQYVDQSKNLFVQMQDQMQQQTKNMFQGFPFGGVNPGATEKSDANQPARANAGNANVENANIPNPPNSPKNKK